MKSLMELYKIIFFSVVVVFSIVFILSNVENEQKIEIYLEKSVSLIGGDLPRNLGFE